MDKLFGPPPQEQELHPTFPPLESAAIADYKKMLDLFSERWRKSGLSVNNIDMLEAKKQNAFILLWMFEDKALKVDLLLNLLRERLLYTSVYNNDPSAAGEGAFKKVMCDLIKDILQLSGNSSDSNMMTINSFLLGPNGKAVCSRMGIEIICPNKGDNVNTNYMRIVRSIPAPDYSPELKNKIAKCETPGILWAVPHAQPEIIQQANVVKFI